MTFSSTTRLGLRPPNKVMNMCEKARTGRDKKKEQVFLVGFSLSNDVISPPKFDFWFSYSFPISFIFVVHDLALKFHNPTLEFHNVTLNVRNTRFFFASATHVTHISCHSTHFGGILCKLILLVSFFPDTNE